MYVRRIAILWLFAKQIWPKKNYQILPLQLAFPQVLSTLCLVVAPATISSAEKIDSWLEQELPQLTQLYESLHQTPELSFEEASTAARMAEWMGQLGLKVTQNVGGHGVVAVLENGEGNTLLLRADMDALPVAEQTGLSYASKVRVKDPRGATVGVMHACGHDLHMTNLVGAVRYLANHRGEWQGTLVVIFQPAEERGAGAKAMIADGLLRRFPRPDFALAMHVSADSEAGKVEYLAGYAMANVDSVDIVVKGRGGHGAFPETTIDPIVIAARLVLDLQTIVSREVAPIDPAVITIGSIHAGTKHNIISDECRLQLTVRSYSPVVRQQLIEAISRKALAAAQSANAPEPEITTTEGTPSLYNDPQLIARLVPILKQAIGEDQVVEAKPVMGGEDFGRLGRAGIPIAMLKLGTIEADRLKDYESKDEVPPSLHSPKYYPDLEQSIPTGVKTFVIAALELLKL